MALFGDQMTDVMTPDGRRITVPAQLAAQFPGLTPVQPPAPVPDQLGQGPVTAPNETPAGPPPLPVAPPAPAFSPQDNADLARANAPQPQPTPTHAPATSPAQMPEPGPANTPPPMSSATLGKAGNAGVYNAESSAVDEQKAAAVAAGRVDADQATKTAHAMELRDAESQRILEERQKAANDDAKALNDRMASYEREAKSIANTKIDRELDHPMLAAIGVALGAIGASMEGHGGNNPALTAMFAAIDRKVAGQMQDIDKRRTGLATQRDMIGMQREASKDRIAEYDKRYMAAIDQAKQKIETIGAASGSDRTKAAVQTSLAALDAKKAGLFGEAAAREQAKIAAERQRDDTMKMHAQTIGATIRGQNIQSSQFDRTLDFNMRKEAADLAEKYAALGQKDKADKAKHIGEAGIWDPSTGKAMLDPEGRKKNAQADQLEAQSRQVTDPAQQQKLNATAAALRESAQLNNAVTAPSKEVAEKLRPVVIAAQNISDQLSEAERMLSSDPSAFSREQWAGVKTNLGDIAAKYAQVMGERVSPRAIDNALEHIVNFDPESMYSRFADKGKAIESIKTLRKIVSSSTDAELKGNQIQSGWTPVATTPKSADAFGGKTAAEVGSGEEPGIAGKAAEYVFHGSAGPDRVQARQDNATDEALGRTNAKGQSSNYGLDPADDDQLRALIKRDSSASHSAHADIVQAIAGPLTKSDRPTLAAGMLRLLRDEKPALYREVLAAMPPEQAKDLERSSAPVDVPGLPGGGAPNKLGPDAMAAYNAYLRSKGLPPVSQ